MTTHIAEANRLTKFADDGAVRLHNANEDAVTLLTEIDNIVK